MSDVASGRVAQASSQYPEERPLKPEALARLARVFLLLASVKLPDEQANEKDYNSDTEPSSTVRGLRSGQHG